VLQRRLADGEVSETGRQRTPAEQLACLAASKLPGRRLGPLLLAGGRSLCWPELAQQETGEVPAAFSPRGRGKLRSSVLRFLVPIKTGGQQG